MLMVRLFTMKKYLIYSLCKKTPNIALFSFLKRAMTKIMTHTYMIIRRGIQRRMKKGKLNCIHCLISDCIKTSILFMPTEQVN